MSEPEYRPATEQEKADWVKHGTPPGRRCLLASGHGLLVDVVTASKEVIHVFDDRGFVYRVTNMDEVEWEYMYSADHREKFPYCANVVQVRMLSGEWRNGRIQRG